MADNLKVVPLVFALWLRYLTGIGDDGKPFELSPDPLLDECRKYVTVVEPVENTAALDELLHRKEIFGVDLFEAGLADTVKSYFAQLNAGKGAVRKVLSEI